MDNVEFIKNVPVATLARVFKDYFEQHMAVYDLLRGIEFVSLDNIDINSASLVYSIKVLDDKSRHTLLNKFNCSSASLNIYGRTFTPTVYIDEDLLYININK